MRQNKQIYREPTITSVDKRKRGVGWKDMLIPDQGGILPLFSLSLSLCVSLSFRIAVVWILAMGLRKVNWAFLPTLRLSPLMSQSPIMV